MSIALAQVALEAGDLSATLDHALAAWAEQPGPALSRAIHALSAQLNPSVPAELRGRKDTALRLWLERAPAASPPARAGLLATLLDVTAFEAGRRLAHVASWPADPRVDEWCVGALEQLPYRATSTQGYWKQHFARLERVTDPTLLPRIEALATLWGEEDVSGAMAVWLRNALTRRLPDLRQHLSASEDEGLACDLEARLQGSPPRRLSVDELLDIVYARPEDDGARLVYADALMERGDPRGEFISLQMQQAPSAQTARRIKAMLAEHGADWLAEVTPLVRAGYVFERGFLAQCTLKATRQDLVRKHAHHPVFRTVHTLSGSTRVGLCRDLLALRDLSVDMGFAVQVEGLQAPWVDLLSGPARPIERLAYAPSVPCEEVELALLARCEALPHLRVLDVEHLEADVVQRVSEGAIAARVETLAFRGRNQSWLAFAAALPRACVPRLVFTWYNSPQEPTVATFLYHDGRYDSVEVLIGPAQPSLDEGRAVVTDFLGRMVGLRLPLRSMRVKLRKHCTPELVTVVHSLLRSWVAHVEIEGP